MLRIIWIALLTLASALRSRRHLVLENLALRQQLAAFKSRGTQPRIRGADRAFWVVLRRLWSRWADALVIVKPDTVFRWHRAGFKLYWNWISRRGGRTGRPAVDAEIRDLIRKMAAENRWGAPRTTAQRRCPAGRRPALGGPDYLRPDSRSTSRSPRRGDRDGPERAGTAGR